MLELDRNESSVSMFAERYIIFSFVTMYTGTSDFVLVTKGKGKINFLALSVACIYTL